MNPVKFLQLMLVVIVLLCFVDQGATLRFIFHNLFGPVYLKNHWSGDESEFRQRQLAAVKKIFDPEELERIANFAPDPYVRAAAIKRIDRRSFLESIALTETNPIAYKAAIERLDLLGRVG